ncbi:hypothetical protein IGI04_019441, partial [Brassica rapa subsp. trilocularis]
RNFKSIDLSNPDEPDDEPHIKLKLLTRRIPHRKPFFDPISDAPTLAETIHGADLSSWNPNPSQQDFLSKFKSSRVPARQHSISSSHKAFLTTSASCSEQSQLTFTSQADRVPNQPARKGSNSRPDRRQRPSSSRPRFISPSWRSGFYNLQDKGNPNYENMNRTWLFCKD